MNTDTHHDDAAQPAGAEFLSLQGRYTIDPANTRDQLLEDAYTQLIGGLSVLDACWEELDSSPHGNAVWCAVNALRQAKACMGAALAPTAGTTGAANRGAA